jgi:periplasmic protein TonB
VSGEMNRTERGTPAGQSDARGTASEKSRRPLVRYSAILVVVVLVIGGAFYLFSRGDNAPPKRQVRDLTVVKIMPPPPPPPPPPPMPEQKMIEQPKMAEPEIKQDKPIEKPKDEPAKDAKNDEPPGPLSLDAKAEGPGDLFQLGGHPGGNPYGGGGGGSRWGWYATIVQEQIEAALRGNEKTRNAVVDADIVRVWADSSGRVTRVQLATSAGNPELDAAIRNEALGGLVLREPPPKDMPMPIVVRLTLRRPS